MQAFLDWLHAYGTRWHDAWDILAALASAGALAFAVSVAAAEHKGRRRAEAERDEARREQLNAALRNAQREREQQARRIVLWGEYQSGHTSSDERFLTVTCRNFSDMPVMDVSIVIGGARVPIDGEGGKSVVFKTLLPTESITATVFTAKLYTNQDLAIQFRDAAGVHWARSGEGKLAEYKRSGAPLDS